jgi:hypothetical protein
VLVSGLNFNTDRTDFRTDMKDAGLWLIGLRSGSFSLCRTSLCDCVYPGPGGTGSKFFNLRHHGPAFPGYLFGRLPLERWPGRAEP